MRVQHFARNSVVQLDPHFVLDRSGWEVDERIKVFVFGSVLHCPDIVVVSVRVERDLLF